MNALKRNLLDCSAQDFANKLAAETDVKYFDILVLRIYLCYEVLERSYSGHFVVSLSH